MQCDQNSSQNLWVRHQFCLNIYLIVEWIKYGWIIRLGFSIWWRTLTAFPYFHFCRSIPFLCRSVCTRSKWYVIIIVYFGLKMFPNNEHVYVFSQYFKDLEPSSLLFDVSCMLCALFWPIFLCHFATHTTDRVSSIGDVVYSSNWFEYPAELQKYTILTISRSQQPIYFTGLGLVNCTLEVFGKVSTPSRWHCWFKFMIHSHSNNAFNSLWAAFQNCIVLLHHVSNAWTTLNRI